MHGRLGSDLLDGTNMTAEMTAECGERALANSVPEIATDQS